MSNTSNLLGMVMLLAVSLRLVLDLTSIWNPRPGFDLAYSVLFFAFGVAVFLDGTELVWGYTAMGVALWSFVSYLIKNKKSNSKPKQNT